MTKRLSLELSDSLADLASSFDQFSNGGVVLDDEAVFALVRRLKSLKRRARDLENEVSQKRWNAAAKCERLAETEAILAAVTAPDSNVVLFPVIPRPFSDGRAGGAA